MKIPKYIKDDIYKKTKCFTVCRKRKTFSTIDSVEYIINNNIKGDFIECGVFMGGQVMTMILTLNFLKEEREIFLYDTFNGCTRPEGWEKLALKRFKKYENKDGSSNLCNESLDNVKNNILSIPFNKNRIHFIKGKVEDTLNNSSHKKIALLRMDTDFYSSTKHELETLYPKVSVNGIIIIDDYGYWDGAKKATDEYLKKNNVNLKINKDCKTSGILIKG